MKQGTFSIAANTAVAPGVFRMELKGDTSAVTAPGQFINIRLEGNFLRRPISVHGWNEETLTILYKVVGKGTEKLSSYSPGTELDILTGLGNGFSTNVPCQKPLLIGGGIGTAPLFPLACQLCAQKKTPTVILGFNTASEIFGDDEYREIGCETIITTVDGSAGIKGFVTDAMKDLLFDYYYACGPEPMLKAVFRAAETDGELSFEERMGCGFGACMGCSCKTVTGYKRICKDGPVLKKEEILW